MNTNKSEARKIYDKYGPRVLLFLLFVGVGVFMWAVLSKQVRVDTKNAAAIAAHVEKHDHIKSTQAQIASCERGNKLRMKINQEGDVIAEFMQIAINSAAEHSKIDTGKKKALDLKNVRLFTATKKKFGPVPITKCAIVIKKIANSPAKYDVPRSAPQVDTLADD